MRILAALACALLVQVTGASAQTIIDPRLEPMNAHYARLAQAYAENDAAMILAYRTPDFFVETPGGRIESDVASQILVDFLATSQPPIQGRTEVLCATLASESQATFTVVQHLTRTTELNGASHQLATAITQNETWRLTADGWRLASVSNMHDARRWVDGVEVDPSRPYDPRARAYRHRESAPEVCATPLPAPTAALAEPGPGLE
jgi:hypothetical protein